MVLRSYMYIQNTSILCGLPALNNDNWVAFEEQPTFQTLTRCFHVDCYHGNIFMSKILIFYLQADDRSENLNKAYSYYLKAYDILDEIEEKNLVDKRELALMKARICLNCGLFSFKSNFFCFICLIKRLVSRKTTRNKTFDLLSYSKTIIK
jgi:hypothetical protein